MAGYRMLECCFVARVIFRHLLVAGTVTASCLGTGCESISPESTLYGAVEASVVRRNGDPIPKASLVLYTGQRPMGYGETDQRGKHLFSLVPEGVYGVRVVPPAGYLREEDLFAAAPTDYTHNIRLEARQTIATSFELIKDGKGILTASVADPHGLPIAGVGVALYARGNSTTRTTGAAGTVTFSDVQTGNYGVVAIVSAKYRDVQDPPFIFRDGILVEPDIPAFAKFTLVPCGGRITVSVRDNSGSVVPNARLLAYNNEGIVDSTLTAANGVQVFSNLPCLDHGVRVRAPGGWVADEARGSAYVDGLMIHRGTALSATLTLRVCRATLRVRVQDAAAVPVTGAMITLYTADSVYRVVGSGADGVVLFDGIPCREYGVTVTPPAGFTVATGNGSSYYDGIRLDNGETAERTFVLQRAASANDR